MKLHLREWAAIGAVFGFLIAITLISTCSQVHSKKDLAANAPPSSIIITLLGAVDAPGEYECRPGISVKELLKQTHLKSAADRKKIPFKRILFHTQVLEIPEKNPSLSSKTKNSLVEN